LIQSISGQQTELNCTLRVFSPHLRKRNLDAFQKNPENAVSTFERKILRRVYGPVQDNGQWRIRYNKELCELYCEPDLVACIRLKRLQWAGHVQRMEGTRIPKKVLKVKFGEVRSVGKPRKR
jgi:hypothetical protein